ncbi:MAG TPA: zinc metalloprotease HtpX [Nitrospirota bacterium]|nr:zinc metalloprotease HtpX [Nitrospirota bacterium]
MPLTFIDIERQKSRLIWVFFLILMLVYFAATGIVALIFLPVLVHTTTHFWIFAGIFAFFVSGVHFWFSAYDTVNTVIRGLNAQPPDPKDDVHKMLTDILEEIRVVTGNKRKIQSAVIPSLSLNALAAEDLKGEAVIGITEGLLSRLSRPQLETVIAHEAHHILSGDCLEATVATSLFGAYAAALENLEGTSRERTYSSPAFLLAWGLLKLSNLLTMFISREREYRADAAAVRMTRNPIALAETLHLLSRRWRGAGFIGSGFEMLCIVNPRTMARDETEGFWADLLSTHPPIDKRIDVLLKMARVSITELDKKAGTGAVDTQQPPQPTYYAMNPQQQWQGPFSIAELGALPWLSPLSWVTTGDKKTVERSWKDPLLNAIFTARLSQHEGIATDFACPSCQQPLVTESYEGTQVYRCRFCAGTLVENSRIPRVLARTGRDHPCSERIIALAKTVVKENQLHMAQQNLDKRGKSPAQHHGCAKCKNPMSRGFYSLAYLIEIDRCSFCGLTWFDQDELEMLQCLIESGDTSSPGSEGSSV